MVNTEIRQFRETVISITNTSPLPIEIKRLVFFEIMSQIDIECEKVLILEKQKENENNKEEDKNE